MGTPVYWRGVPRGAEKALLERWAEIKAAKARKPKS
jgi:hypothetical protein